MAGRVLAFLLSSNLHTADPVFLEERQDGTTSLNSEADQGVNGIWWALGSSKKHFRGGIKKPTSRRAVLRGALALHGTEQGQDARNLISLLHSQEVFREALIEIIEEHFNIDGYDL